LHNVGILHNNIRFGSIRVTPYRTYITDLSRATVFEDGVVCPSKLSNDTVSSIAPELFDEKWRMNTPECFAADYFSLGTVLYKVLYEHRAFADDNSPAYKDGNDLLQPHGLQMRPLSAFAAICQLLDVDPRQRPNTHIDFISLPYICNLANAPKRPFVIELEFWQQYLDGQRISVGLNKLPLDEGDTIPIYAYREGDFELAMEAAPAAPVPQPQPMPVPFDINDEWDPQFVLPLARKQNPLPWEEEDSEKDYEDEEEEINNYAGGEYSDSNPELEEDSEDDDKDYYYDDNDDDGNGEAEEHEEVDESEESEGEVEEGEEHDDDDDDDVDVDDINNNDDPNNNGDQCDQCEYADEEESELQFDSESSAASLNSETEGEKEKKDSAGRRVDKGIGRELLLCGRDNYDYEADDELNIDDTEEEVEIDIRTKKWVRRKVLSWLREI
jgi:hypothetical protein